jgi:hypothetical protein
MLVVTDAIKLLHKIDIKDYDIECSDRQAAMFWGKNNASNFRAESLYTEHTSNVFKPCLLRTKCSVPPNVFCELNAVSLRDDLTERAMP